MDISNGKRVCVCVCVPSLKMLFFKSVELANKPAHNEHYFRPRSRVFVIVASEIIQNTNVFLCQLFNIGLNSLSAMSQL